MKENKTTSQDLILDLNAELQRIGAQAGGLEVYPTDDFTVLQVVDNQETSLINIQTAENWMVRLQKLEDDNGFENAWQELIAIPNWEIQ